MFLTKPEVRKDIREIQRTLNAESDSDDDIRTEDIIDCRNDYPVKPRKAPRGTGGGGLGDRDEQGHRVDQVYYDVTVVESTMSYINNIRTTKPELWAAEVERDRLDALRHSIQSTLLTEAKHFQAQKKEQEGYFRLLQGAHMRGMLLQNAHARQNTMTYDVLKALKIRRENLALLDSEILRLKTLYTNAKSVRSTTKSTKSGGKNSAAANNQPGTTSVLHVAVGAGTPTARDIYLHRGQHINTPMGEAVIQTIFPSAGKVVLRLPFGIMYSALRRVLCWGAHSGPSGSTSDLGSGLDVASDSALTLKWKKLRHTLCIPSEAARGIAAAISPLVAQQAANPDPVVGEAPEDVAPMEEVGAHDVEEPDPENDNRLLFSISQGSSGGGEESMAKYFLPVVADTANTELTRPKLKASVVETIGPGVVDPRLVMAPPAALPYLLDQKLLAKNMDTRLCPTSITSTSPNQPGVTGTLTWDANTEVMKRALQERGQKIESLETELFGTYEAISASRRRAAKLAVETSALRMAMFTRRVRHRNNLSDRGINGGPALAALDAASVQEARAAAGSNDPVAISLALQSIAAKAEADAGLAGKHKPAMFGRGHKKPRGSNANGTENGLAEGDEDERDEAMADEDDEITLNSVNADDHVEENLPPASKKRGRSEAKDERDSDTPESTTVDELTSNYPSSQNSSVDLQALQSLSAAEMRVANKEEKVPAKASKAKRRRA